MKIELNIKVVKREAEIGEYILITHADDDNYKNYDVFEVIASDYWGDGAGIAVILQNGNEHGVFHYEYHVLEAEGSK